MSTTMEPPAATRANLIKQPRRHKVLQDKREALPTDEYWVDGWGWMPLNNFKPKNSTIIRRDTWEGDVETEFMFLEGKEVQLSGGDWEMRGILSGTDKPASTEKRRKKSVEARRIWEVTNPFGKFTIDPEKVKEVLQKQETPENTDTPRIVIDL